jgi:hypothetical protein
MRGRTLPELHPLDLAGVGIEPPEHPGALTGVPHRAVRRGRHVVRVITGGDGEIFDFGGGHGLRPQEQRHASDGDQDCRAFHDVTLASQCEQTKARG